MQTLKAQGRPAYGVDGPGFVRGFFLSGIGLTTIGVILPVLKKAQAILLIVKSLFILSGAVCLSLFTAMIAYAIRGKYNQRNYMLSKINWRGDEQVLDVGTGRGLLMVGAAKHLTSGKAIGIDIWRAEDLTGNGRENALSNGAIEGVSDKIEIRDGDVRKLEFQDNSFDVITSLLCLHNIENPQERRTACREIARVLKPGGTVLIGDYIPTGDYATAFAEAGLIVESSKPTMHVALSLMWLVIAHKPA